VAGRTLKAAERALMKAALAYPEAREDHPWGDTVVKVKGKIFVFCGFHQGKLYFTAKLPHGRDAALMFPFTKPTGYGLGKAGWVSASFASGEDVPLPMLLEWLDESYRAVAPAKLVRDMNRFRRSPARSKQPAKSVRVPGVRS
jgi:predicted DNA-binding protein (MmcQ/YjbR family)